MEGGRRAYSFWTEEEEAAMKEGVAIFGAEGQWRAIKETMSDALKNRTVVKSEHLPIQVCTGCELSMVGAADGLIAAFVCYVEVLKWRVVVDICPADQMGPLNWTNH